MDADADNLETFRQQMGTARETTVEDTSSEAVAARKELILKNLFSRKIQREESVKELAQLLAISRGRSADEELGGCATSNDSSDTAVNSLQSKQNLVEDNFSTEEHCGLPTPTAPPLTQSNNITTTADTATIGGSIRNLWKGLTHSDQHHPHQSRESKTPQCQQHQHKLECSICLDEFKPNETVSWAKDGGDPPSASLGSPMNNNSGCDHIFHQGCLTSWLDHHDDCPLCRRKLVHQDADVRFSGSGWEVGR